MICSVRGSALALIAASFCLALGAPAQAGCVGLSGTADGFDKETAVSRAQLALADYVKQYKAEKRLRAVTVSAMRASPQPYWRSSVSENMFCLGIQCGIYKPDIVNASSYTVCWHGVVSPLRLHLRCKGLLVVPGSRHSAARRLGQREYTGVAILAVRNQQSRGLSVNVLPSQR